MNRANAPGKLTLRQQEVLQFIIDVVAETDEWPPYVEIMDHFGFASPNSVTQYLKALHKKGHLVRKEDAKNDGKRSYRLAPQHVTPPAEIPIKGVIAAGRLQEAVAVNMGSLTLDYIFPDLERIFALRVAGESMRDAGIHDGDYVLIMNEDIPEGGIGAVLYNGETSLKRVYHDPETGLRLESANPEYDDIHIEPGLFEEVTVIGRYVGHVDTRAGTYKRVS
jgi:repressor LexA